MLNTNEYRPIEPLRAGSVAAEGIVVEEIWIDEVTSTSPDAWSPVPAPVTLELWVDEEIVLSGPIQEAAL
jgi:hypothetical protein